MRGHKQHSVWPGVFHYSTSWPFLAQAPPWWNLSCQLHEFRVWGGSYSRSQIDSENRNERVKSCQMGIGWHLTRLWPIRAVKICFLLPRWPASIISTVDSSPPDWGCCSWDFQKEGLFWGTRSPPTVWHHVCRKYNSPICQFGVFGWLFNVRGPQRIPANQQVSELQSVLSVPFCFFSSGKGT